MVDRRNFIKKTATSTLAVPFLPGTLFIQTNSTKPKESEFAKKLKPIGRVLEEVGYYVWCNTPIYDEEGNVHVFYSRWLDKYEMSGWISKCEIARDMGFYNHEYGLLFESEGGLTWNKPEIAYYETDHYFKQPPKPKHLSRYGRLERPQLLLKNGKPEYLFTTSQGGKYNTASGYIFKIE